MLRSARWCEHIRCKCRVHRGGRCRCMGSKRSRRQQVAEPKSARGAPLGGTGVRARLANSLLQRPVELCADLEAHALAEDRTCKGEGMELTVLTARIHRCRQCVQKCLIEATAH